MLTEPTPHAHRSRGRDGTVSGSVLHRSAGVHEKYCDGLESLHACANVRVQESRQLRASALSVPAAALTAAAAYLAHQVVALSAACRRSVEISCTLYFDCYDAGHFERCRVATHRHVPPSECDLLGVQRTRRADVN